MVAAAVTGLSVGPSRQDLPGVLMVLAHFWPTVGGTETQARSLAAGLVKAGYEVTVLTTRIPGIAAREVLDGILVERALRCRGRGIAFALTYGLSLLHHVRRLRSGHAILHAHHLYLEAMAAAWVGMRTGLPTIAKVACGGIDGDFARLRRTGLSGALPLLRRLRRVVAISKETEAELAANGFARDRIVRIPNGVDTVRFARPSDAADDRERSRFGQEVVLFLGRLDAQKGLDVALEAWAQVASRRPEAQLILAGDGPARGALEGQAGALGLARSVRFLGRREDPELLLRASQVFILPSRSEGMSNALLEAMAAGLACVATRVGGNDELVQDGMTGLLVPPGDPEALAESLLALLQDATLRARLGAAARVATAEQYGMDHIVSRYADLYGMLAAGAHR